MAQESIQGKFYLNKGIMNSFIDGVRSLINAHNGKLNELAMKSTAGMSIKEIAQSVEDGGREIAANLRRRGINVDY